MTGRSASTDFLAIARITGEMMGSAIGFFFILVFTIEQIGPITGALDTQHRTPESDLYSSDVTARPKASQFHNIFRDESASGS